MLDALESITNAIVGLVVSLLLTWLVLGYSPAGSIGVTAMFFAASFLRSYVLRTIFRMLSNG